MTDTEADRLARRATGGTGPRIPLAGVLRASDAAEARFKRRPENQKAETVEPHKVRELRAELDAKS